MDMALNWIGGEFCSGYGVAFLRYLMYHVGLALTGEDKESCRLAYIHTYIHIYNVVICFFVSLFVCCNLEY